MEHQMKHKKTHFLCNSFPSSKDDTLWTAYFTGFSVVVVDGDAAKEFYENGCFGIGSITKSAPLVLRQREQIQPITRCFYDKKMEWKNIYGSEADSSPIEKVEIKGDNLIVTDPYPIKEKLILSLLEAFYLHYTIKCLRIIDFMGNELTTENLATNFANVHINFFTHFVAYQYLRSKNWIVKSGLKFAGDFLLYKKGPRYYHASYIVLIRAVTDNDDSEPICSTSLHGNYRIAETSKKELLLLEIHYPRGLSTKSTVVECLEKLKFFKAADIIPQRYNFNKP